MEHAINIADQDMVIGCRNLVREESILAGPSSGAVITALKSLESSLPDGSVCVVIIHDRGDRYMDTVYSDEWVKQQFGKSIWGRERD
ncbi:putative siderophore biosynthesis protein SbnA [compost metagenome]